jgi:hypothetical protein
MASGFFELFDWIADAFAGWRYLFSRSFRQRTHKRWKADGWGTAAIEILFGGLAVLFTLFLMWLLIDFFRAAS